MPRCSVRRWWDRSKQSFPVPFCGNGKSATGCKTEAKKQEWSLVRRSGRTEGYPHNWGPLERMMAGMMVQKIPVADVQDIVGQEQVFAGDRKNVECRFIFFPLSDCTWAISSDRWEFGAVLNISSSSGAGHVKWGHDDAACVVYDTADHLSFEIFSADQLQHVLLVTDADHNNLMWSRWMARGNQDWTGRPARNWSPFALSRKPSSSFSFTTVVSAPARSNNWSSAVLQKAQENFHMAYRSAGTCMNANKEAFSLWSSTRGPFKSFYMKALPAREGHKV